MKKKALIIGSVALAVAMLLSLVVLLISCSKDKIDTPSPSPSGSGSTASTPEQTGDIFSVLAADGIVVIGEGKNITIEVDNATTILELKKYVEVAEGIFWMLATDISRRWWRASLPFRPSADPQEKDTSLWTGILTSTHPLPKT